MISSSLISGNGVAAVEGAEDSLGRILVVAMGQGEVLVDGKLFVLTAGSVFFLRAGTTFRLIVGEVQVGHFLRFNVRYVDYFLLQYPLGRGLGLFDGLVQVELGTGRLALVLNRIRVLAVELDRGAGFEHLKLLFSLLLLDMVHDRFAPAESFDPIGQRKEKFHLLVEQSFKSQRSTRFYAVEMGLTPRRLRELCRGWYGGKGVFEVVMDRLISESEFLLLGTDLPIKAIAYELGFSSSENFGTYFMRYRGLTPKQFRAGALGG